MKATAQSSHCLCPFFDAANIISEVKKNIVMYFSLPISYIKYVNRRRTGLVTFRVETAFYNGLLTER